MKFLEVKDIEKSFGGNRVLKGVSFGLDKGKVLVIIGSSGSGKTTLLRSLNFLERPDVGTIWIGGNQIFNAVNAANLGDRALRERRLHFGLVFQSFNLFPQHNVLKNVALAPTLLAKEKRKGKKMNRDEWKRERERIEAEAIELIRMVGLEDKLKAYPCELSGGQQQRVAIARAVLSNPKLILADEPTGNLDSTNGREVMELLSRLHREGTTIIMVTHSQHDATYADRIVNLYDGQIVERAEL